ncbi:MAG: hypothetical protein P8013_00775 [Candidatus Sulfobium sp.]
MKKFLPAIFCTLFVMSFTATAFAIHAEIPSETQAVVAAGTTRLHIGGDLRIRGWYLNNVGSPSLPGKYNSFAYYDHRVRLDVNANISPNLQGMVQLESNTGQRDTFIWGNFNSKPTDMGIRQAWIIYSGAGLLGFRAGLKIGHMPLILGDGEFFDHRKYGDDAVLAFLLPSKGLEVDLLAIKLAGDGAAIPSNIPNYGIKGYKGSKTDNTADLDGYVAVVTYKVDGNTSVGVNYTYLNLPDFGFSHQNIGFTAKGQVSGFGYRAAADFQFGSNNGSLPAGAGRKFRGYAVLAGLNYMIDKVNLRAGFAYGSGDDDATDDKHSQFEDYLTTSQRYTLVYEYKITTTAGRLHSGVSNTTYYNLGLDLKPVKDMKVALNGYIIRASATMDGISKDAGWEVDGRIDYHISKNLVYRVDAGYFEAGSFYPDTYSELNGKKEEATVLRHLVELSF